MACPIPHQVSKAARMASLIASNAALYCITSLMTAYIPTGFVIQFRPAVVIPAVFAAAFGPLIGGLGAAIGTFIASMIRYGTPVLTLFSGTPGNFAGFYVLGWIFKNWKGDWRTGYVVANVIGLVVGFSIIAAGLYLSASLFGMDFLVKWTNLEFVITAVIFGILSELPFSVLLGIPILRVLLRQRVI